MVALDLADNVLDTSTMPAGVAATPEPPSRWRRRGRPNSVALVPDAREAWPRTTWWSGHGRRTERTASVRLVKRIPPGAGLGGGSADAAAVLRWAGCHDTGIAAGLGADVPSAWPVAGPSSPGAARRWAPLPFEERTFRARPAALRRGHGGRLHLAFDRMGGPPASRGRATGTHHRGLRRWRWSRAGGGGGARPKRPTGSTAAARSVRPPKNRRRGGRRVSTPGAGRVARAGGGSSPRYPLVARTVPVLT